MCVCTGWILGVSWSGCLLQPQLLANKSPHEQTVLMTGDTGVLSLSALLHDLCFIATSCTISEWGKATTGDDDGSPPPPPPRPRPSPLRPRLGMQGAHQYLWTRPVTHTHTHTHTHTGTHAHSCIALHKSLKLLPAGCGRNPVQTKRSVRCAQRRSARWPQRAAPRGDLLLHRDTTLTFTGAPRRHLLL